MVSTSLIYATLALLQQDQAPDDGSNTMVRVIAGIGALVLIALVFLRRKSKKKAEDDF
jgi:LPXTG-motif cell wall-anchored protein